MNTILRAIASVGLAAQLVAGCSDARPGLEDQLSQIELPADFVFIDSEQLGPQFCFAGDCPRAVRVFGTTGESTQACAELMAATEGWSVVDPVWTERGGINPCDFRARMGGAWLNVDVSSSEDFLRFSSADVPEDVVAAFSVIVTLTLSESS